MAGERVGDFLALGAVQTTGGWAGLAEAVIAMAATATSALPAVICFMSTSLRFHSLA